MNTLIGAPGAPAWLHEVATARTRYEELLGWPVSIDVERRRLMVPVGTVLDAVTMPAALGRTVLAELRIAILAGPVTADPAGHWWTFLIQPAAAAGTDLPAELRRLKVRPTPRGGHAIVPIQLAHHGDGGWRWVQPPRPRQSLPPRSVVLGATRRVAAGLASSGH
ncbi:MAG: hypothetical protein ACRDRZ_18840 [Pseudonocardiaceae bacterium]